MTEHEAPSGRANHATGKAFEDLFDALRRDVADFPDGEISVESKEIAALLKAYDDSERHRRALAYLANDLGDELDAAAEGRL